MKQQITILKNSLDVKALQAAIKQLQKKCRARFAVLTAVIIALSAINALPLEAAGNHLDWSFSGNDTLSSPKGLAEGNYDVDFDGRQSRKASAFPRRERPISTNLPREEILSALQQTHKENNKNEKQTNDNNLDGNNYLNRNRGIRRFPLFAADGASL